MTIFFLDLEPRICASYHCNGHLSSSIKDITIMLCWSYYDEDGMVRISERALNSFPRKEGFYKKNIKYFNDLWPIWIRENQFNWKWAYDLAKYLVIEFHKLSDKLHVCGLILDWIIKNKPPIPKGNGMIHPPLTFGKYGNFLKPSKMRSFENIINLYKFYYVLDKRDFISWENRKKPFWIERYREKIKTCDFDF